ncbi:PLP-dependent aminotransferase family protein [Comamonas sp. GB3 AK4-5]|uniref:MocR-like pyridoxine biosynthesis transcription factor PdxR n=1 Tax=Comamonas sp. GB3 AK4-5 TaxID=3231487 RepID=UPI00351EF89F
MDLQQLAFAPLRGQEIPMYLQLHHRYRDAITSGQLQPGDRVPSVRSLASELNLARGTVELAYQMLTSEGYLQARGPAGCFVSPSLGAFSSPSPLHASAHAPQALHRLTAASATRPLQLGLPALDAFPRKTWTRLLSRNARSLDLAGMAYPDPAGHARLRQAIATYLGIARGIACAPEQVFVTAGYRGALELICRTLLHTGDTGWLEEPGYLFARQFLQRAGMQLAAVPVDAEGLNVAQGLRLAPQARFAVLTPTHQSPMGMALSLPRRLELLEWARQRQAWIIEDDYDSEFRYHGRPLPALKSLDHHGHVLYSGTFSKVLFPGLRLAYLVVPTGQIKHFQDAAQHLPGPGALLQQATVADFMEQGHFARHLRKMRALYAVRRGDLVQALEQVFGPSLQIQPQAGGIHVLARLAQEVDGQAWAAAAQAQGLAVQALSDWCQHPPAQDGLLMGFTNIASPQAAQELALRLHDALAPA